MTPNEMYEEFNSLLDTDDGFLTGAEVWRKLDAANREIFRVIAKQDPTYFVQTETITLVADTALYDLPLNARLGSRILFTEDIANGTEITPLQELRSLLDFDAPGIANTTTSYHFIMEGKKVRIVGKPGSSGKTVRVWYIPTFGQMIEGEISAATTTTLTLFTDAPNYTTNFGKPDVRDDFYNGMEVLITENAGVGDQRTITDYTGGSTLTITVDSAWSETLSTTSGSKTRFAIMSPVPEDFHQMVPMRSAIDGAIKTRTRIDDISRVYYGYSGRPGLEKGLLAWLQNRQDASLNLVVPMDVSY